MERRRGGYLRLYRKSLDERDPFWGERPFDRWRARLDLIGLAAYREHAKPSGTGVVVLRRGEFLASLSFLAQRWGWSIKTTRGFLSLLADLGTVEIRRRTPEGIIYGVVNYELFQGEEVSETAEDEGIAVSDSLEANEGAQQRAQQRAQEGHRQPTESKDTSGILGHAKGTAKGTAKGNKRKKDIERREKERKEEGEREALPALPPDLDYPEMRAAWDLRIKERGEQKAKGRLTPSQVTSQFKLLSKVARLKGPEYAVFCVERATAGHHQGVVFNEDLDVGRLAGPASQTRLFQPEDDDPVMRTRKRFGGGAG